MLKQVRVAIGLGVILSLGSALFLWIKPQGIGRVPEENARNVAHFEPLPRGAMRAAAFSIHAYERDTQAYLSQVVPGRAFQVQSPRPGLASIQAVSSLVPTVRALGNVELRRQGKPGDDQRQPNTDLGLREPPHQRRHRFRPRRRHLQIRRPGTTRQQNNQRHDHAVHPRWRPSHRGISERRPPASLRLRHVYRRALGATGLNRHPVLPSESTLLRDGRDESSWANGRAVRLHTVR